MDKNTYQHADLAAQALGDYPGRSEASQWSGDAVVLDGGIKDLLVACQDLLGFYGSGKSAGQVSLGRVHHLFGRLGSAVGHVDRFKALLPRSVTPVKP
jgi:hypothetical protein